MRSCRKFVSAILVPYFVLVTCSTSMAEELSSNSVILGSSTEASKFVELAETLRFGPRLPTSGEWACGCFTRPPMTWVDPNTASKILATTRAAAVWDYGFEDWAFVASHAIRCT